MGIGKDTLEFLEKQEGWWSTFCLVMMLDFMLLYILDFFSPPHFPGRRFLLFPNDRIVGPTLLFVGVFSFIAACALSVKNYPGNPIMVAVFMCPVALGFVRKFVKPSNDMGKDDLQQARKSGMGKMAILEAVTDEEEDQRSFYRAVLASLVTVSLCSLTAWVVWANVWEENELGNMTKGAHDREVVYITWAAPLIFSVALLAFALMVLLRVCLDQSYNHTCETKMWALRRSTTMSTHCPEEFVNSMTTCAIPHISEKAATSHSAPFNSEGTQSSSKTYAGKQNDKRLQQQAARLAQLSDILKFVGCALLFLIGALYVTFQLVATDSHLAMMVQSFLAAIFFFFLCFIHLSFKRLWDVMSTWLLELPLWRKALDVAQSNWMRAVFVGVFLPYTPFFFNLDCHDAVRPAMSRSRRRS